jgi:hypothetical protein
MNRCLSLSAVVSIALLAGCAHTGGTPSSPATNPQAMLDAVKGLKGEWMMIDDKGVAQPASTFTVSSNGSVVREIMFQGTEHEMTNMYHLDGNSLIMTHYCAMGNQPRMRAVAFDGKTMAFAPDSVTNLKGDAAYMGSMTMTFVDANNVSMDWRSIKNGKPDGSHDAPFKLTRKK